MSSSVAADRSTDADASRRVVVCVKHAPRRVQVDPLNAAVCVDQHDVGLSAADEAALELGLRHGSHVTVVTAGDDDADRSLRAAAAAGAHRLVRCPAPHGVASRSVAEALATVAGDADIVFCGDYSADRGSGSVPGFVAGLLGVAQALGVVSVSEDHGRLIAHRRLDRGRREVLRLPTPVVVSVEGGVARLRRASLQGTLAARDADVELGPAVPPAPYHPLHPHRPRVQLRPAPAPEATPFERIQMVTQATTTRTPPRLLHLEPDEAAAQILAQLRAWGYLPDED